MSARRSGQLAAVAVAAVALTACGGDDETIDTVAESGTASTTAPASVAVTTVPAVAPVTTAPATTAAATAAPPATTASTSASATTVAPATTAAPTVGGKWQDPGGVFAVAFPAEPSTQNLQAPLPDGTSLPVTAYLAEVDGAAAIASCVVYPDGSVIDPTPVLESARDGALANVGAEFVDSQPIELQGRPGVGYRGVIGEAGGVLARTYLDGLQLCQVLVVGEPATIDVVAPPFLDSFEFLQEAAA